jgi:hypothetical protein
MIIVNLKGGLGNQMFQYAFGKALSFNLKTDLKYDTSSFTSDPLRDFALDCLKVNVQKASKEEVNTLRPPRKNILPYLKYKISNKVLTLYKRSYINEQQLVDYSNLLKIKSDCYLDGYWQSEEYFKNIRETLLKDFVIKYPIEECNKDVLERIRKSNSVSLHVRRGDYVSNPKTNAKHGVLGLDYYDKAMEIIAKNISNPIYFVFSDDISWAEKNLKSKNEVFFVNNNYDKDYEDLRLMRNCKNHIIANSSFSWWGAWLSQNPKKVIIAPKQWFSKEETKRTRFYGIVPKEWIKI